MLITINAKVDARAPSANHSCGRAAVRAGCFSTSGCRWLDDAPRERHYCLCVVVADSSADGVCWTRDPMREPRPQLGTAPAVCAWCSPLPAPDIPNDPLPTPGCSAELGAKAHSGRCTSSVYANRRPPPAAQCAARRYQPTRGRRLAQPVLGLKAAERDACARQHACAHK
jgi:hypothetical protein